MVMANRAHFMVVHHFTITAAVMPVANFSDTAYLDNHLCH